MSNFSSVLSAARQLSEKDRLRLIEELWDTVSTDAESPFSEEWAKEIERRVAELDAGTAETVGWSEVRKDAMARIKHGKGR